ncbi:MAG: EF-P lysine aminoacylase GenX [Methylococcaceae bacterium]|nr:EF-P lysine aminoacylase GenX [Methylococcaceae bacterium]
MTETARLHADWRPGCSVEVLRKRAWMLAAIRSYFDRRRVMEVETPSLCRTVGSDPNLDYFASGLSFEGSGYDCTLYLQTSPEFSMKRLLAAGSGSIYQICKAYRNGEAGRLHNPEFTILEWYRVGYDLEMLMDEVDELLGRGFGLAAPGRNPERITYQQAFISHCGFDPLVAEIADFRRFAEATGDPDAQTLCGDDIRLWQEYLFSARVQPQLGKTGLCHVYDYPANQCALACLKADDPRLAERAEVFYQGLELANGFRELDSAGEQRERFQRELEIRRQAGKQLPSIDERLLAALNAGLPDCSGMALGLDRLLMCLVNASSIDEVMSFSLSRA